MLHWAKKIWKKNFSENILKANKRIKGLLKELGLVTNSHKKNGNLTPIEGIVNDQPTESSHQVAFLNKIFLESYRRSPPKLFKNLIIKKCRKFLLSVKTKVEAVSLLLFVFMLFQKQKL